MNFITAAIKLISRPKDAVSHITQSSFSKSYLFFLASYSTISIFLTLNLWLPLKDPLTQLVNTIPQSIEQHFPNSTSINVGTDSIDTPNTITIPMPSNSILNQADNLSIVDLNAQPKDIENKSTYILATKNHLTILLSQNPPQSRTIPYTDFAQEGIITKQSLLEYLDLNTQLYQAITPIIPILIFLGFLIGLTLSRLIFILLYTLATQAIGSLLGHQLKFSQYYKLGMYTIVGTEIISLYQKSIYPSMPTIFFPLTFLLLTTLVLLRK